MTQHVTLPLIVLAAACHAGCSGGGSAAETTTAPGAEQQPEVIPALATAMHPVEPDAIDTPEPDEQMAEAAATMDRNAAKLGDVVQRVDELVASALSIQKSLLMIYAEEEEEEPAEDGDAETEGETEGETEREPEPTSPEY